MLAVGFGAEFAQRENTASVLFGADGMGQAQGEVTEAGTVEFGQHVAWLCGVGFSELGNGNHDLLSAPGAAAGGLFQVDWVKRLETSCDVLRKVPDARWA